MKKVLFGLIILVLGLLGYRYFISAEGVQVGDSAPMIESTLLNGQEFALSDLRGDYVLIDFWGSWCAPCRKENPKLVQLYKEFEKKKTNDGGSFRILSIALEKMEGRAENAIKRDNLYWDLHIVSLSRVVLLSPLANKYKVSSIPTSYLINPNGKIMMVNPSVEEVKSMLSRHFS